MIRNLFLSLVVFFTFLASGCSIMAPKYSAAMQNIQMLKDSGDFSARVGEFSSSSDPANVNPISLRGSKMSSPYEGSYSVYLAEALRQELSIAGKLASDAEIEISGVLLKNDLDASGLRIGTGDIQARFVIRKGEQTLYDQIKTAHLEWESSFAGAVAVPRAQAEYQHLVQKLLSVLYADPAFSTAIGR